MESNPITILRENKNLSQRRLAQSCRVSPQLVMRTEQGLLTKPNENIMAFLVGDDWRDLTEAYTAWQISKRVEASAAVRTAMDKATNWIEFRKLLAQSTIGFCKLLCIHPQVLASFEKRNRTKLSPYLINVFKDAGLTDIEIARINELVKVGVK